MNAFRFNDPWWLAALAFAPLLLWRARRTSNRRAALFSSTSLVADLPISFAQRLKAMAPWTRTIALTMGVVALARPQLGREEFRLRTDGVAVQMVIDRSASMRAVDFSIDRAPVDRLTAVKHVFEDFVRGSGGLPGRPNDQIGLVAFGGFVDVLCPLTLDHDALLEILRTVHIPTPIIDGRGQMVDETLYNEEIATAIGDSIAVAVDRLKDSPAKSKLIVLLSDGESNAGVLTPNEAAELAKEAGVKIHSIGVGSTGVAPTPVPDLFGRIVLQPTEVRLDEKTLRDIAKTTGGQYFNAKDVSALREVYREIDGLEKTAAPGKVFSQFRELYAWWAWPSFSLALLETVVVAAWLRSLFD